VKLQCFVVFLCCSLFGVASALAGSIKEYSADMVDVKSGKVMQKLAVAPDKMFSDSLDDQGKRVASVIVRVLQ
jgi:hypothetical protein